MFYSIVEFKHLKTMPKIYIDLGDFLAGAILL